MNTSIKIQHKVYGVICEEIFVEAIQFKIFLQSIHGCLKSKVDLDFFNGQNFLLHIPYEVLKESVINTKFESMTLTEKFMNGSPLEK